MATHSIAPVVRAKLVQLLTTAVGSSTVSVTYSNPGSKRISDNVYLGDIPVAHDTYAVFRGTARKKREEEHYTEVIVDCFRGGDDSSDAEAAAFTLFGAVEDAIANDVGLGLNTTEPTLRCLVETWKMKVSFDMGRDGWAAKITAEIRVQIRLQ